MAGTGTLAANPLCAVGCKVGHPLISWVKAGSEALGYLPAGQCALRAVVDVFLYLTMFTILNVNQCNVMHIL